MDIFKLKDNNTTVKTEFIAGLTTFFTMSYLFVLSPKLLETAGLNFSASISVTGIVTFLSCLIMSLIANKPYAVAPLLGETAFISYTICNNLGFSVKTALASVFICGFLLLFMTLTNLREYIVSQIPENIKLSYCIGLGLFFIFIALKDIGIVDFTNKSIPLQAGNICSFNVIMGVFCFLLIIILSYKKVRASVLIAILVTTFIGIIAKDVNLPSNIISAPVIPLSSFMQFDFSGIFTKDFISVFLVIFMLVNIDTAGALLTLSYTNNEPKIDKKTMISDSISVICASFLGTTTTGAYIDSLTGIKAGGKTGLTSIVVGFLFLSSLIFTPIIEIIPCYAYAPALLYVGILITTAKVDFDDITEFAPVILTVCVMVFTYNIGLGIISAFIIYPLIKIFSGNFSNINWVMRVLFVIAVVFFAIYPY